MVFCVLSIKFTWQWHGIKKRVLTEMLQKELDMVHAEIQESKNQSLSTSKQFMETRHEMQISIDLLHQQILSCHEQITLSKQFPRGKGHGCP